MEYLHAITIGLGRKSFRPWKLIMSDFLWSWGFLCLCIPSGAFMKESEKLFLVITSSGEDAHHFYPTMELDGAGSICYMISLLCTPNRQFYHHLYCMRTYISTVILTTKSSKFFTIRQFFTFAHTLDFSFVRKEEEKEEEMGGIKFFSDAAHFNMGGTAILAVKVYIPSQCWLESDLVCRFKHCHIDHCMETKVTLSLPFLEHPLMLFTGSEIPFQNHL